MREKEEKTVYFLVSLRFGTGGRLWSEASSAGWCEGSEGQEYALERQGTQFPLK